MIRKNILCVCSLLIICTTTLSPTKKRESRAQKFLRESQENLDPNPVIYRGKETLLHRAAENLDYAMLATLFTIPSTDAKIQDIFGETALHKAVRVANLENSDFCCFLVKHCLETVHIRNHDGQTPAMLARSLRKNELAYHIDEAYKRRND